MATDEPMSDAERVTMILDDMKRPFNPASVGEISEFLGRVQHHRAWLVEAWWRITSKMDQQDAELERARQEAILLKAQAEGAGSLLLDVQQDCIALHKQLATAQAIIARMHPVIEKAAELDMVEGDDDRACPFACDATLTGPRRHGRPTWEHASDCPILAARAVLEGERES